MMLLAGANPELERLHGIIWAVIIVGAGLVAVVLVVITFFRSLAKSREEAKMAETQRMFLEYAAQLCFSKTKERAEALVIALSNSPDDSTIEELHEIACQYPQLSSPIYSAVLDAVESSGGRSIAKRYALQIGRIAYGSGRPNGAPTTYDEQAIRNDISARTDAM